MTIAERLGADTFSKYLEIFEFDQKTGIDISGEATGIMYDVSDIGPVELATMGFGQSLTITPIQLLRAASAVVNGGRLITPHFGVRILDDDGRVLKTFEYETTDTIISKETSESMKEALISVVSEGGGSKAQVDGYLIGGKTATSQKLPRSANKYISSFIGFSATENPELIVLCIVDEPEGIYYGGTVCAPVAKEFFENALEYLEIREASAE
jgi:stage V sporulation protein D (sporulation-specific penicillin-binding protein)